MSTDQSQDWGRHNYLKGYYKVWVGSSLTIVPAWSADHAREAVARKLGIDGNKRNKEYRVIPRRPELIARMVATPATLEDMLAWERIKIEASGAYRKEVTAQLRAERKAQRQLVAG